MGFSSLPLLSPPLSLTIANGCAFAMDGWHFDRILCYKKSVFMLVLSYMRLKHRCDAVHIRFS